MKTEVVAGELQKVETDALIVNLFEGVTSPGGGTGAVDKALDGYITELISAGDLTGKVTAGDAVPLAVTGDLPGDVDMT